MIKTKMKSKIFKSIKKFKEIVCNNCALMSARLVPGFPDGCAGVFLSYFLFCVLLVLFLEPFMVKEQ